jgi:hypothetical protein
MAIHSRDDAVIREFALKKPVFRIVANTQSSMGATGYTTGLAPSMSLGCGAYAGNITSDNITPLHLLNVKRLAYELPREGRAPATVSTSAPAPAVRPPAPAPAPTVTAAREPALDFICEEDVRRALREGRRLRVAAKAIVTPAARDAAAGTPVLELDS